VHLPGECERIQHPAQVRHPMRGFYTLKFGIEEGNVEGRVVDNQFRVADKFQQRGVHVQKGGLARQSVACQTVHLNRAFIDFAFRIQVLVKRPAGQPPIEDLHAADFNDAMVLLNLETGGFRIKNDLAH
jgi:hypothetical protein